MDNKQNKKRMKFLTRSTNQGRKSTYSLQNFMRKVIELFVVSKVVE